MKMFIAKLISHNSLAILGILAIVALVIVQNYTPGTWYWGWDNLVPEINPTLSINRQLAGFWQEYQGLGTVGGHGYMAALPHTLSTLILDLFLPTSAVRYAFTFLMYTVGGLGSYFLIKHVLQMLRLPTITISPSAFLGSVYYLLSLGTVLTFYVQLEPFIVMYGILPWALLQLFQLLNVWSRKQLIWFFMTNLALSTIGFIPPVFVTYLLFVLAVLIWYLKSDFSTHKLQHVITLLITLASAHAYWILPLLYYSLTQSDVYLSSKLNQISTEDFLLKNKAYGTIFDVALLKGFFFESLDLQKLIASESKVSILDAWQRHLANPFILVLGYGLFGVVLTGFVFVWKNRVKAIEKSLLAVFLLILSGLAMNVFPFSLVSTFMSWIPFFNQAFRSPYNKLSMSASLLFAILFAVGMAWIMQKLLEQLSREEARSKLISQVVAFITIMLVLFSLPSFQGHFLFQGNKVSVPNAYFEMFDFFQNQSDQTRVMTFPLQTYNGWVVHDWGYTGSGFLWYGIKQPLMDRAFDVWSTHNETFYNEASRAFYLQDAKVFQQILEKYDVSYVLIDESVNTWTHKNVLSYPEAKQMMTDINAQQVWSKDFLTVYQVRGSNHSFVYAPKAVTQLATKPDYTQFDPALQLSDSYLTSTTMVTSFPFNGLAQSPKVLGYTMSLDPQYLSITAKIDPLSKQLVFPSPTQGQYVGTLVEIRPTHQNIELTFLPWLKVKTTTQEYALPALETISLPATADISTYVLLINNQVVEVENNQSKLVFLQSLAVGEPIAIEVLDKRNTRWNNGSLVVDEVDTPIYEQPAAVWETLMKEKVIPLDGDVFVTLQIATEYQEYAYQFKDQTGTNCDVWGRGTVEKKPLNDSVSFSARGFGAYCQTIALDGITTQTPAMLVMSGNNVTGRGLKVSLTKNDESFGGWEVMTSKGRYEDFLAILDWPSQTRTRYYLTLESKSYGQVKSRNELQSLKIMPLAATFEYLSAIHTQLQPPTTQTNNVSIAKTQKLSNFFYRTDFKPAGSGIVVLSQSVAPGWIAYVPYKPWKTFQSFTYNGWAYAWNISSEEKAINLLYWPQVLSFIGFGLIPSYIFWLKDL